MLLSFTRGMINNVIKWIIMLRTKAVKRTYRLLTLQTGRTEDILPWQHKVSLFNIVLGKWNLYELKE